MPEPLTPEVYGHVFETFPEGALVLQELAARFYDAEVFAPGQADVTSYRLGQRSVVRFILGRLNQIQEDVIDVRDQAGSR